ncbi:hypothetical protein HWV62_6951 [Athelia sp. TMB]|nr:hypothetical protein HWV62_6951 [Athelia sp. TMB]
MLNAFVLPIPSLALPTPSQKSASRRFPLSSFSAAMSKPENLRRESDLSALKEERKNNAIPWSISPFQQPGSVDSEEELTELEPGELRVRSAEEVPFIDLLLEIAMTTAGLTRLVSQDHGAPEMFYSDSMRYEPSDMQVFVQLIVFSAMAAFTDAFDITNGIASDPTQGQINNLLSYGGFNKGDVSAQMFRNNRLPVLNARGISMSMGLSRMVLLIQYLAACFFAAFAILFIGGDNGPSTTLNIIKVVLWFLPIFVEVISHFVALHLPGFVGYTTEGIYARSGTVFLIIMGAALDKITGGFKNLVGNAGLGAQGIPVFGAAAVIFIGFFSLFFATPGSNRETSSRRTLAWFFSQFCFLSALIVTLQAVANSISFVNLNGALLKIDGAIQDAVQWQLNNTLGTNLTASTFPNSVSLFNDLGLSFEDTIDELNADLYLGQQQNSTLIWLAGAIQTELAVFGEVLSPEILDATPDQSSLLFAKLNALLATDPTNTTALNYASLQDIYSGILKDRGSSALWLYPAAGATILGLVLMSCIKGMPRDKYEWGILGTRCTIGTATCFLAILDIGSSKPIYDADGNMTDSKIWFLALAEGHWLLILLALIMALIQITENVGQVFAYLGNRSYHSFEHLDFINGPERRRTQRRQVQYQRTYTVDKEDYDDKLEDKQVGYSYPNPYEHTYHDRDADTGIVTSPRSGM